MTLMQIEHDSLFKYINKYISYFVNEPFNAYSNEYVQILKSEVFHCCIDDLYGFN